MKELFQGGRFLRFTRTHLRFGTYSREPLQLLRFAWKGDSVECDWLMRPSDPWDEDLPRKVAKENQTQQSLVDALGLREAIFKAFPAVSIATLRMFRADADHQLELVMIGNVSRQNEVLLRVASMVMKAKLCGFHFNLREGGLESFPAAQ